MGKLYESWRADNMTKTQHSKNTTQHSKNTTQHNTTQHNTAQQNMCIFYGIYCTQYKCLALQKWFSKYQPCVWYSSVSHTHKNTIRCCRMASICLLSLPFEDMTFVYLTCLSWIIHVLYDQQSWLADMLLMKIFFGKLWNHDVSISCYISVFLLQHLQPIKE